MLAEVLTQTEVLKITIINFIKLFVMTYLVFYKLPQYLYPQDNMEDMLDKIVYNVLYMLSTVLIIVPFLLVLKIFSIITFLLALFLIKLATTYYFEKKNYIKILIDYYQNFMIKFFNFLDNVYVFIRFGKKYNEYKKLITVENIISLRTFKIILFIGVFSYVLYSICLIDFISLNYRTSDMPVYLAWVSSMSQYKTLFPPNYTEAGYFFGPSVIIFFLQLISNIDSNIILNLYPPLFFLFLLINIYYVIYKSTNSYNSAIFAIIIYGLYCLSPLASYILGFTESSLSPNILNIFGIKFYFSFKNSVTNNEIFHNLLASIPFGRINSGLPYEMAYTFYPLYIYFFIMTFLKKTNHFLLLYTITLYLVFTLHGGAAVYLFISSVLILINAFLFRKVNLEIFWKGLIAIIIGTIMGNLWLLSIIKYGVPPAVGAAAPILDKLFHTQQGEKRAILSSGNEYVFEVVFLKIQLFCYGLIVLLYPLALFFRKNKRFIISSFSLAIIGLIIIYLDENFGLPRIVSHARSNEYILLAAGIGAGLYFNFFESIINKIFKKYSKIFLMVFLTFLLIVSAFIVPKWNDTDIFFRSLNSIQYSSIVLDIYKIRKMRLPYTWTVVAYVQSYPRVLGKGFHINTQNFIKKYSPTDKYLKVPTDWIYIFKENIPGTYEGFNEWYFKWRKDIQNELEVWLAIYSKYHNNIRIFDDKEYVTVYEIDNREYMKYLNKKAAKNEYRSQPN